MEKKMTIGELIKYEVLKQQISITQFAKLIHCKRNNVYNIFERPSIDILLLKRISKVLNRNFFKDIAEDINLINENEDSDIERLKRKAVSQFFEVVPKVLNQLGKSSVIVFSDKNEFETIDSPVPDFLLPDYLISFTIEETLKERLGDDKSLLIETIKDEHSIEVETCTNTIRNSLVINVKIDYKTESEWFEILKFAFEVYSQYNR